MTFIEKIDDRSAKAARDMAWMYIQTARSLDPEKYPSDAKWVGHFIARAKEYWASYKFYRRTGQ